MARAIFPNLAALAAAAIFLSIPPPAWADSNRQPVITSVRADAALVWIEIAGVNFGTKPPRVTLGNVAAALTVTSVTPTLVTALLPPGMTPGGYLLSYSAARTKSGGDDDEGSNYDEFWVTLGAAGPQGPAGAQGAAGVQGPIGATGLAGPEGAKGDPGPQGSAGKDGAVGPAGSAGVKGDAGPAGTNGAAGAQGPMGPQGPAGVQGPAGPEGPAGSGGSFAAGIPIYEVVQENSCGDAVGTLTTRNACASTQKCVSAVNAQSQPSPCMAGESGQVTSADTHFVCDRYEMVPCNFYTYCSLQPGQPCTEYHDMCPTSTCQSGHSISTVCATCTARYSAIGKLVQ